MLLTISDSRPGGTRGMIVTSNEAQHYLDGWWEGELFINYGEIFSQSVLHTPDLLPLTFTLSPDNTIERRTAKTGGKTMDTTPTTDEI